MIPIYKKHLRNFVSSNKDTLKQIFRDCWKNINQTQEIPMLKDFLLKKDSGVDYLNSEFSKIESDYLNIKFSSVYSHGSPKVTFRYHNKTLTRELADLLVIIRINEHQNHSYKTLYSSSFLSQWKLNKKDNKNEGQTYLYDKAKSFLLPKWIGGQVDSQRKRKFSHKTKSLNFFYLNDKNFSLRPAKKTSEFETLMLGFLNLKYGLEFASQIWTQSEFDHDDWSQLMNDLLLKVGRTRKVDGQPKLIEYRVSNNPFQYEIEDQSNIKESGFQSILIVDINFNKRLKIKQILK